MKKEDFIKKIIERVRESAIHAMEINLEKPAGKSPDKKLLAMSVLYHSLNEKDRKTLKSIFTDAIDEAIFGFLCVLDGARGFNENGLFELLYKDEDITEIINSGDIDLHDIYLSLIEE